MQRKNTLYLRQLLKNRYFIKNFLILITISILFFGISALMFDNNSKAILENELLSSNRSTAELMANSVDSYMDDIRYVAAILDTSTTVNTFFTSPQPEQFIANIYQRLEEQLRGYQNSYASIASIYLYSQRSDQIITASSTLNTGSHPDLDWMNAFTDDPAPYVLLYRAYRNNYPFYLTLLKQIRHDETDAAVVINVDLSKLPVLAETENQSFFIITDDQQILYRQGKKECLEPLSAEPRLSGFSLSDKTFSIIRKSNDDHSYAYTQLHSDRYGWTYVLITDLPTYSEDLTGRRVIWATILLALFFTISLLSIIISLRFFKPVQMLTNLLNESGSMLEDTKYASREITELAHRIIYYTQTNRQLSEELSSSLEKLNQAEQIALQSQINPHFLFNTLNIIHIEECRVLGYDHTIPELTMKLSNILHHAFDSSSLVPLKKEFEYTRQYIDLMNARNRNALQTDYDLDPTTLNALVPKLFIQPIIENIFFHAFSSGIGPNSQLTIRFYRVSNDRITVEIADNGDGIPNDRYQELIGYIEQEALPQTNIGLKNVIRRMKLIYGDQFFIEIQTKEKEGTRFTLTFPYIQSDSSHD